MEKGNLYGQMEACTQGTLLTIIYMEQGRISGVMEECIMEPGSLTSGKGTFSWPDGRQYIGDYVDDKK